MDAAGAAARDARGARAGRAALAGPRVRLRVAATWHAGACPAGSACPAGRGLRPPGLRLRRASARVGGA
eukprot:5291528-Prymnesium_polylepis.1